jgi:hypothetical protein
VTALRSGSRSGRAAAALALLAAWLAPVAAAAGVIHVPAQVRTIAGAVNQSAPGDTIRIVGNGGATYPERLDIPHDLTLEGGWRADFLVRDPAIYVSVVRDTAVTFTRSVIRIGGASRVTIDGLTVVGGRLGIEAPNGATLVLRDCEFRGQQNLARGFGDQPGAAIYLNGGTLLAERVRTTDGLTAFAGAGLALVGVQSATVRDCTFTRGTSRPFGAQQEFDPAPGGGILLRNSTALLDAVRVMQCAAALHEGGGLFATGSTIDFVNCEITQCFSPTSGGAMHLIDCPRVTFNGGRIESNVAGAGAGLAAIRVSFLELSNVRIAANTTLPNSSGTGVVREGSGAWLESSSFTMRGVTFDTNGVPTSVPQHGGAVWSQSSSGLIESSSFLGGAALASGGAWHQVGGDLSFVGCQFRGNRSGFYGGATHIELGGKIRLENTLLEGNSAKFGGGCSASFTGRLEVERCTFTGNFVDNAGASVYLDTAARATVSNTIACCSPAGGQISCSAATAQITHSNFWNDDAVNVRAEYSGSCPDVTGTSGNLRGDPLFCAGDPSFSLSASSPCLGAASDGGDLGWTGAGCARALSLKPESWGRIKARYGSPE